MPFLLLKVQVLTTRQLYEKIDWIALWQGPCLQGTFDPSPFLPRVWDLQRHTPQKGLLTHHRFSPVFGTSKDIPPKRESKFTLPCLVHFCLELEKKTQFWAKNMDHRMGGTTSKWNCYSRHLVALSGAIRMRARIAPCERPAKRQKPEPCETKARF